MSSNKSLLWQQQRKAAQVDITQIRFVQFRDRPRRSIGAELEQNHYFDET
jgi:hypothetical protein